MARSLPPRPPPAALCILIAFGTIQAIALPRFVAIARARYTGAMKPPRRPPSDSGRPGSDRPSSGRPTSGRPTSGRPTSGHPTSGRPTSDRPASGDPRPPGRIYQSRGQTAAPPAAKGRSAPDRSSGPRPATPRPHEPRPTRAEGPRPERTRPTPDRPTPDRPAVDGAFGRGDTTLRAPTPDRATPDRATPGRTTPDRKPAPRHAERPPHTPRETPGNSLWIYGLHAVAAALGNPARHLRRLLLTEEGEAATATRLARPWALTVERTERGRLDHLLGPGAIHQGAALLVEPLAPPSLQSAVARPGPILVLDQVSDPRNIGAILRAAAAFGVAAVITQDRNAPEETGALAKAASGALETVPFLRAVNIARTLVALRAAGFWVIGLDASGGPLSGPALAERRIALVLGSEGEGMRRLTRETSDETAAIHMPGASALLDSLNVSTAAAIALYELARR